MKERLALLDQQMPPSSAMLQKDTMEASETLLAYELVTREACMAALPEEAKKAVSSMADPQGPSCVLLRSEATSEADVSKECEAPLYGVAGMLDSHAFTYEGIADQPLPRWSPSSQRKSRGNRLTRNFADNSVEGGP